MLRVGCAAAGYGLINSNMLNIVLTALVKVLCKNIKSNTNKSRRSERDAARAAGKNAQTKAAAAAASVDDGADAGSRRSTRVAAVATNRQLEEEEGFESDEDPEENDEMILTQSQNEVFEAGGEAIVYKFLPLAYSYLPPWFALCRPRLQWLFFAR